MTTAQRLAHRDAAVAQLHAAVSALQALDLSDVDGRSGPGLHRELSRLAGQVHAVAALVLARVEADGRWLGGGARTFGEWVARREGSSVAAARRTVELGKALEDLPRTAAAVTTGALPLEHAQILARFGATSEARKAALASDDPHLNEAHLVERAAREGADEFRRTVQRWAHTVDEAAAEVEHERAAAREHLSIQRRSDGVAIQGFLTHEHGEAVVQALRAVAGVPAGDDPRSREERQAAALLAAARLILDRGMTGAGQSVRPHLSVHVSFESLRRQLAAAAEADGDATADWLPETWRGWVTGSAESMAPAELDDGSPIPPSLLARLACDSELSRVVFGPDSEVLDLGRSARVYTGQQRRAVVARDRSCRYPGCGAPPTLGEVHHADWWVRDRGSTSVPRGVLLCWYHHDLVHRRRLTIARDDGRWRFWRDDGSEIGGREAGPEGGTDPGGGAVGAHQDELALAG